MSVNATSSSSEKFDRSSHPPRLLLPPTSHDPQSLCEYTPLALSSTRTVLTSFSASELPRLVTASPGVVHLAATNAAMESVVPATTTQPFGLVNADLARSVATAATLVPGARTFPGSMDAYGRDFIHAG